jgi:hypothetical protein
MVSAVMTDGLLRGAEFANRFYADSRNILLFATRPPCCPSSKTTSSGFRATVPKSTYARTAEVVITGDHI